MVHGIWSIANCDVANFPIVLILFVLTGVEMKGRTLASRSLFRFLTRRNPFSILFSNALLLDPFLA